MLSKFPAPVKGFSNSLVKQVLDGVDRGIKENPGPHIAAFDADGTLWSWDVGETFFDYQLTNSGLKDLPSDPWEHYEHLKKTNPPWDCMWLAQINRGVEYTKLQAWVADCFSKIERFEFFQFQKDLIDQLRARGLQIYVVTASVRWAVAPLAREVFGIDEKNVLGIETHIRDGIISDDAVEPIVWGPGKAAALLKATGGLRPLFSCGNSMLDMGLLECASHVRLTINSHKPGTSGHATETKLATTAHERGWLTHQTY